MSLSSLRTNTCYLSRVEHRRASWPHIGVMALRTSASHRKRWQRGVVGWHGCRIRSNGRKSDKRDGYLLSVLLQIFRCCLVYSKSCLWQLSRPSSMDFIRGFFRRNDASDPTDYSDQREKRGSVATAPDYDEAAMALDSSPQLEEFQLLVGSKLVSQSMRDEHQRLTLRTSHLVKSHSTLRAPKNFSDKVRPGLPKKGRPAPNRGIYPSVVDYECVLC